MYLMKIKIMTKKTTKQMENQSCDFTSTFKIANHRIPHRCPICEGSEIVPHGFYNQTSGRWSSSGTTEKCRTCMGIGIVWG